jgi:hypothetical protein
VFAGARRTRRLLSQIMPDSGSPYFLRESAGPGAARAGALVARGAAAGIEIKIAQLSISPMLDDYKTNDPVRKAVLLVSTKRRRTMKYVCLGYYDKGKFDGLTESEQNAMFDVCFEYDDHLRTNGNWAGGEALQSEDTALTLYWKNGKVATTDGPYAETKEQLGGILVLEARDMNHAVQLMAQHPALTYGNIFEIRPAGDMNEIIKASEQRRRQNTAR